MRGKAEDPLRGRSVFAVDESLPSEIEVINPQNTFRTPFESQADKLTSRNARNQRFASQHEEIDRLAGGFTAGDWPSSAAFVPGQAGSSDSRYQQ